MCVRRQFLAAVGNLRTISAGLFSPAFLASKEKVIKRQKNQGVEAFEQNMENDQAASTDPPLPHGFS